MAMYYFARKLHKSSRKSKGSESNFPQTAFAPCSSFNSVNGECKRDQYESPTNGNITTTNNLGETKICSASRVINGECSASASSYSETKPEVNSCKETSFDFTNLALLAQQIQNSMSLTLPSDQKNVTQETSHTEIDLCCSDPVESVELKVDHEKPSESLIQRHHIVEDAAPPCNKFNFNFSEKPDEKLVFEHGILKYGQLDNLIELLIPSTSYCPNQVFIFILVLGSRLHIKPHELLGRVFRLTFNTPNNFAKYESRTDEMKVTKNLINLLGQWTEFFPYDFREEKMMMHVRGITEKCVTIDPSVQDEVSQLLTSLLARLTALEKYENFLHRVGDKGNHSNESKRNLTSSLFHPSTPSAHLICSDAFLMAEQLTIMELERFSHIGPEEFVEGFMAEKESCLSYSIGTKKSKEVKKTKNLESYMKWSLQLKNIVASDVCLDCKKKTRRKSIEYWIEVAKECFNIGNFNSLMAVISGLNVPAVSRLKKTWEKIDTTMLDSLQKCMDPACDFDSYRSLFKSLLASHKAGLPKNDEKIIIPFFSLLIKDLSMFTENCSIKMSDGFVNFDAFWQLARKISEVIAWQKLTCHFNKLQSVINFIQTYPAMDEQQMLLLSYEHEEAIDEDERKRLESVLANKDMNHPRIHSTATLYWPNILLQNGQLEPANTGLPQCNLSSNEDGSFNNFSSGDSSSSFGRGCALNLLQSSSIFSQINLSTQLPLSQQKPSCSTNGGTSTFELHPKINDAT